MNDRLLALLEQTELDLTAIEIAEILWLSRYLPTIDTNKDYPTVTREVQELLETESPNFPKVSEVSVKTGEGLSQDASQSMQQHAKVMPRQGEIESNTAQGLPVKLFQTPSPPLLSHKVEMLRSLRPLTIKKISSKNKVVDENRTVNQIAEIGIWQIIEKPKTERVLSLDIVIDNTPSMQYWQWVVDEFYKLIKSTGAFNQVRLWQIDFEGYKKHPSIRLYSAGSQHGSMRSPGEFVSLDGERAIVWITDGSSTAWHDGRVLSLLSLWTRKNLLSLLPVIPYRLWYRSGLRNAIDAVVRSNGRPYRNIGLKVQKPVLWPFGNDSQSINIPIINLSPESLHEWAKFMTGVSPSWSPALVFPEKLDELFSQIDQDVKSIPPEKNIEQFHLNSSDKAWNLAICFSIAAPLSIPLMRLIQQSVLPVSNYDHLFEVLMGGIIKPIGDKSTSYLESQYEFLPGIRELLGNYLPQEKALQVLTATSKFIGQQHGLPIDFPALLAHPELVSDLKIGDEIKEFAWISSKTLKRYGSEFTKLGLSIEKLLTTNQNEEYIALANDSNSSNRPPDSHKTPRAAISKFQDLIITMGAFTPPPDLAGLRREYLAYIERSYRVLDFKGIPQLRTLPGELALESVYVPLLARPEQPDGDSWERRLAGRNFNQDSLPEEALHGMERAGAAALVQIEEALSKKNRVVLLGDPGSGKSTMLKHIALRLARDPNAPLPILLPLNAYAKTLDGRDINLQNYLPEYFAGRAEGVAALGSLFKEALSTGKAVILLDGLDEVQSNRAALVGKVEAFAHEAVKRGNRVLVTSRIVGYRDAPLAPKDWSLYTLLDFTPEAIRTFAEKWCLTMEISVSGDTPEARKQARAEQAGLLEAIEANPGVGRLASNPLLLTILALIKRQGVELPRSRIILYDRYLQTLIEAWNRASALDKSAGRESLDYGATLDVLGPLALRLHEESPTTGLASTSKLQDWLTDYYTGEQWGLRLSPAREKARVFLESVRRHSNLLVERGEGMYGFIHLAFEEALAAYGLVSLGQVERAKTLAYIRKYLLDPAWRETILLAVGVLGLIQRTPQAAGEVVRAILKMTCSGEDAGKNLLMAGVCLEDVGVTGLGQLAAREVQEALIAASRDHSLPPTIRRDAGFSLARTGWVPKDLDDWVFIPEGEFLYGNEKQKYFLENPFSIAKYPVTNLQYKRFIDDDGYNRQEFWSPEGWTWKQENSISSPAYWTDSVWNNPLTPVVGISFHEAKAYASWLSSRLGFIVRLPSNFEWERAVRGTKGREYPWGYKYDSNKSNSSFFWKRSSSIPSTTIIGQFIEGCSPEGLSDAAGNVLEWLATSSDEPLEKQYTAGGSWFDEWIFARIDQSKRFFAEERTAFIGFRLLTDLVKPFEEETKFSQKYDFKYAELPLSTDVRLLDLLGYLSPTQINFEELWTKSQNLNQPTLETVIGIKEGGIKETLNLRQHAHGPHGLIAGATGSGKSELLLTILAGLAIEHHPHQLNFVLVDYKGGTSLSVLEGLPHTVGLVTDLDGRQTLRALAALDRELERREEILAKYQVADLDKYYQQGHTAHEVLPYLLVVIDEFAELRNKFRHDFYSIMGRFISLAQRGGGLGVHLMLAMQSPEGVVDDKIRANMKYRICLRVESDGESRSLLQKPDAARITVQGRGYFQVGKDIVYDLFQVARVAGYYHQDESGQIESEYKVFELMSDGRAEKLIDSTAEREAAQESNETQKKQKKISKTDIQLLVANAKNTAKRLGLEKLNSPWPPALPHILFLNEVLHKAGLRYWNSKDGWPRTSPSDEKWMSVPVGLLDEPRKQQQSPLLINLMGDANNIFFMGAPAQGKTSFLLTLATSFALCYPPNEINFHLIDISTGQLASIAQFPHVAGHYRLAEKEKVHRLLYILQKELIARQEICDNANVPDIQALKRQNLNVEMPVILTLIDNFPKFREAFHMESSALESLMRDGGKYGLCFAFVSDKLPSDNFLNLAHARGAFYLTDHSYANFVGSVDKTLEEQLPGRGFWMGKPPLQFHIALPVEGKPTEQLANLQVLMKKMRTSWSGNLPTQVELLDDVAFSEILKLQKNGMPATKPLDNSKDFQVPIALDYATHQVVNVELFREAPYFLFVGPQENGENESLLSLILSIAIHYRPEDVQFVLVGLSKDGVIQLKDLPHVIQTSRTIAEIDASIQWIEELAKKRRDENKDKPPEYFFKPVTILVIDDYARFSKILDTKSLEKLSTALTGRGHMLGIGMITAVTSFVARNLRGDSLFLAVKNARNGLFLNPADVSNANFSDIVKVPDYMIIKKNLPSGRGILYNSNSRQPIVQVATNDIQNPTNISIWVSRIKAFYKN